MVRRIFLFLFPLAIFFYFISDGVNLPYVGPNATNFSVYSLIAHNFNRFGYFDTKFAPLISVSQAFPTNPNYFFHHPTLTSFSESIIFKLFGEGFWQGRLTMILYSFGVLILTYFVAKNISFEQSEKFSLRSNNTYAYLSVLIMSVVPATTLFGKMIGQETLVLFFALLLLYSTIKYLKSSNKKYLLLAVLSAILGTLSDWPMLYFSLFLLPLYIKNKRTKQGLIIFGSSILTALLFVALTVSIMGGFYDLKNAMILRSFNGLLNIPFWPLVWLQTTLLRFIIYFNPVFLALSIIPVFWITKQKKFNQVYLVIFTLLGFGLFHIALYTQASFTHPYLIHYLLPFIVFSSAYCLYKIKLNKVFFASIFAISLVYLFFLNQSKNYQIQSNVWRYDLTAKTASYLTPYETVIINGSSAIDPDVLWYPFLINSVVFDWKDPYKLLNQYKHLVFSCHKTCDENKKEIGYLKGKYNFGYLKSKTAEVFIFILNKPPDPDKIAKKEPIKVEYLKSKSILKPFFVDFYRNIREKLKAPQI